jgi:hypothetical protein
MIKGSFGQVEAWLKGCPEMAAFFDFGVEGYGKLQTPINWQPK